ncbi:KEOPS complex Pcc1-like subunit [Haloterrigena sp. SYSU A121-1]|uniref:KEOPS complex Pcc1-like subunit n=1 Tax=Haloterrigena gelatinilytica TaxID=2741724 RepID=A0A8J8KBS0_9EURY|nr:KEOPS complex subunit Pcc1 [Haloterrigena gelatinilytica]NUB91645.1 KEOPS complex Pcc1-like subunit [Haloterrigena gelatinilytica]
MSRRATIRTRHDDPELVARALRPDNTDEMETVVERDGNETETETETEGAVVTHIERETTGGLHSNVDDYAVNLEVAIDVARSGRDRREQREQPADAGSASDADSDTTDTS